MKNNVVTLPLTPALLYVSLCRCRDLPLLPGLRPFSFLALVVLEAHCLLLGFLCCCRCVGTLPSGAPCFSGLPLASGFVFVREAYGTVPVVLVVQGKAAIAIINQVSKPEGEQPGTICSWCRLPPGSRDKEKKQRRLKWREASRWHWGGGRWKQDSSVQKMKRGT